MNCTYSVQVWVEQKHCSWRRISYRCTVIVRGVGFATQEFVLVLSIIGEIACEYYGQKLPMYCFSGCIHGTNISENSVFLRGDVTFALLS